MAETCAKPPCVGGSGYTQARAVHPWVRGGQREHTGDAPLAPSAPVRGGKQDTGGPPIRYGPTGERES